jgi:hypothetical protein
VHWLSQRFPLDFAALLERTRPAFARPDGAPLVGGVGR